MDVSPRTLLRIFLLIGGVWMIWLWMSDGSTLNLAIGVLAAAVGGFGLWWEYQQSDEG